MTAASDTGNGESAPEATSNQQTQALAQALRKAASTAAEQVGGGLSLIFAAAPGDDSLDSTARLRAAAGFNTPHSAREAAQMLLPQVLNAIAGQAQEVLSTLPSLGERAAGGLEIHPLVFGESAHGALVLGSPAPLSPQQRAAFGETIRHLSLLLDHAHLVFERDEAEKSASQSNDKQDEQSEEILKLSEALFAQDIELLRSN